MCVVSSRISSGVPQLLNPIKLKHFKIKTTQFNFSKISVILCGLKLYLKLILASTSYTIYLTLKSFNPFSSFFDNRKDRHNHARLSVLWQFTKTQTQKQHFCILKALGKGHLSSSDSDYLHSKWIYMHGNRTNKISYLPHCIYQHIL